MARDQDTPSGRRIRDQKILHEKWIRPPRVGAVKYLSGELREQPRHSEEHNKQNRVIERPDAQAAPGVEIPEVGLRRFGIQEDSGDEKSGEHKKQVHAHPAIGGEIRKTGRREAIEIMSKDKKNGDATNGVELRDMLLHGCLSSADRSKNGLLSGS
ncbi:MAG TPA: hypothetical protein VKB90_16385 [Candidatus Acidoferrum sp.]|nr:hypothetical protein [Candidatus Acidoferrum sp.]